MNQEYPEIMDGSEASSENFQDGRNFVEEFAKEKHDIIRGFLKEKEIIDVIHKEKINELKAGFEQEKQRLRREFEVEKKELLEGFDKQQVKNMKGIPQEISKTGSVQDLQSNEIACKTKCKEDRVKMRRDYEEILVEKNEEIQMLRRELLGKEQLYNALTESCPGTVVYSKNSQLDDELRRASDKFEIEKCEIRRKFDREKAELVQSFADQTEKMNTNFEYEKARMQKHHEKEIEFKLDITEKLFSEKADSEKTRMVKQFEREIAELQQSLETRFNEDILEKQEVIDSLQKENARLKIALQTERFSLARVYNREMSLLTKPDSQLTNEDLELARQQNDETVSEMERKHQQKVAELKRSLKPLKELEATHRSEIERLKKNFDHEKAGIEAEFRGEQLNLLKSFEFERNDFKNRYEQSIYEKELEMQQMEHDLKQIYEGKIDELKEMVEHQREELELSKKQIVDIADQMEGFLNEKMTLVERLQKEENRYQNLKQTLDKHLMDFEKGENKNEKTDNVNFQKIMEEAIEEKEHLQNKQERLEKENKELKGHLEDLINMSPEKNIRVDTSQEDLESSHVGIDVKPAISVTASQQQHRETETEEQFIRQKEQENNDSEKNQINKHLRKVRENLLKCISEKQQKLSRNLEDVQSSNKRMEDIISEQIVEIDTICAGISNNVSDQLTPDGDKLKHEDFSRDEQLQFSVQDQLQVLQNFLDDYDFQGKLDKPTKYRMNKRLRELTKQISRTHKFEKLKARNEHQQELNQLLKELADEKRKKAQFSVEGLQYRNVAKGSELKCTQERGTSTDERDDRQQEGSGDKPHDGSNEKQRSPSDAKRVQELKRENEQIKKSINELQKSFIKEKEEIMEKLHTQHKEFVMSPDGEIIENLLKEKLALEEALNLERFYLSKLYYLEMKDDLEEILSKKTHQMKREFDREKMEIILKYQSDITDLHNLLSEKDNMELKLLQDRKKATVKLLTKRKMGSTEKEKKKEMEVLEMEEVNLDATISLRKEIAELQKKRYQEHKTASANLNEAINLIKDLMTTKEKIPLEDERLFDPFSFVNADLSTCTEKLGQSQRTPHLLLPDDEIRNRDDLKSALENLVDVVLNDNEESLHDSETTSGTSSDLESEDFSPTPVNEDSDEGAYSGPESADGDVLNIKKAKLDLVFNLERFNLGRVYNSEYRDSLKKALRKLAKAKNSIRSKRRELENDMIEGIKNLVQRTQFGNRQVQIHTKEKETQTIPDKEVLSEEAPKMAYDSVPLRVGPKDYNEGSVVESKNKVTTPHKAEDDTDGKQQLERLTKVLEDRQERKGKTSDDENEDKSMPPKEKLVQEEGKVNETHNNENTSESENNFEKIMESALAEEPKIGKDKMHPPVDNTPTEKSCEDFTAEEETEEVEGNDEAHENGNGENYLTKLSTAGTEVSQKVCAAFQDNEGEENTGEQIRENVATSQLQTDDKKKETGTEVAPDDEVSNLEVSHEKNAQVLKKDTGIPCYQEKETYIGEEKIPSYEGEKYDTPGKVDTEKGYETNNETEQLDAKADDVFWKPETKNTGRPVKGNDDAPWPGGEEEILKQEMEKCREAKRGPEEYYKSKNETEKAPKTRERKIRTQETKDELEKTPLSLKDHDTLDDSEEEEKNNDRETIPGITPLSKKEALGFNDPSKKANPFFHPKEMKDDRVLTEEMTPHDNENALIEILNTISREKFNLLCDLVGIGFVKEIPELNHEKGVMKKEDKGAGLESVESIDDLLAKREEIDKKLQQIDSQINELAVVDENDLNRHQDDEELKLLQSLDEIDKKMRRNDEKDLTEHLLIEKEEVCKKLDEINIQLKGEKESIQELANKDSLTLPSLMTEVDLLKDEKSEKVRQLNHKTKMLEETVNTAGKEKQGLKEIQDQLFSQLLALDRAMDSANEPDEALRKLQSDKRLPMDIIILLRNMVDANRKAAKLTNDIKRGKREIDIYNRILESQRQRLLPFQRKKARLLELLGGFVSKTESGSGQPLLTKSIMRNVSGLGEETTGKLQSEPADADSQLAQASKQTKETKRNLEQLDTAMSATGHGKDGPISEQIRNVSTMKSKIQGELTDLEGKIEEEQVKIKEAGFNNVHGLMRLLEDNKRIQMELAKMESSPSEEEEEVQELPGEENLKELLLRIENLQESLGHLDDEISREQQNCLDALQFQRDGNLKSEVESEIKELINAKDKSVEELQKINEKILQSVSSGGLTGHKSALFEDYIENKMKLEEEIDISQNKIDDEPMRATGELTNLLEKKSIIEENLRDTTEKAYEEVNRIEDYLSSYNEHNNNTPDRVKDLIGLSLSLMESVSNENPDAEEKELNLVRKHLERDMKEKAMKVTEAKRLSLSPAEDEDCLKQLIREKLAADSRLKKTRDKSDRNRVSKPNHDCERKCYRRPAKTNDAITELVGEEMPSIQHWNENNKEKRKILEERLSLNKNELKTLKQDNVSTDDFEKDGINVLETLVSKKVKLEEELRHLKNLENRLQKKEDVEDISSSETNRFTSKENLTNRLSILTKLIQRRETEQQKTRTNLDSKEKLLEQLERETIELEKTIQDITDSITQAKKTREAAVEDVQKDIEKHVNCAHEEKDALRQEIEGLKAEINSCDEKEKELINELRQYQKELTRWKHITPGNTLDLEKMLKEKETLRDYMDEIDRTLEQFQVDHTDALSFDEIEELMKQRRDLKATLDDLAIEKAKLEVEFEDKEIEETRAELMQQKKELEERKHQISNQIVHSGKFGKFAEKLQNSDITPTFVKNVLNEMLRNEKTLIELIKDHEDLKNVSQRQRERLENLLELVKSKVGEDLTDVITSRHLSKNHPNSEVFDRVEGGEETISEILNNLCEENMQLRNINDELNGELDILKGKIGDKLTDELLSQGLPGRELEFADVISTVDEDESTLAEILKKQKEEIDFLEEKLGKNLSDVLFDKEETRELSTGAPVILELIAPSIMKTFDEDLENVIAAYERQLVYLSNESSVLKKKLGDDLVDSLLQNDFKPRDNFTQGVVSPSLQGGAKDIDHVPSQENTLDAAAVTDQNYQAQEDEGNWIHSRNGTTDRSKTKSGTDSQPEDHVVEKSEFETRKYKDAAFEEQLRKPAKLQESTKPATIRAKDEVLKQDYQHSEDLTVKKSQIKNRKRTILENALLSYYIDPNEKHTMPQTNEEKRDPVESLKAPILMEKWDKSLGEIIAQYERDLEKLEAESNLSSNDIAGLEEIMERSDKKEQSKQQMQTEELQNDFSQKDKVDQSDSYRPDGIPGLDITIHKILDAQDKSMEILRVLKERLGDDLVHALLGNTDDPSDDPLNVEATLYDQEDVLEYKAHEEGEEIALKIPNENQVVERTDGEEQKIVGHSEGVQTPKEDICSDTPIAEEEEEETHPDLKTPLDDMGRSRRLKAPSIALKNNKTLGEVIASYEEGFSSLESRIGPTLTKALLEMEDDWICDQNEALGMIKDEMEREDLIGERTDKPKGKETVGPVGKEAIGDAAETGARDQEQKTSTGVSRDKKDLSYVEKTSTPINGLRAPNIMASKGKTLEEVIKDYEDRINDELNDLQNEIKHFKKNLTSELLTNSENNKATTKGLGKYLAKEEAIDQPEEPRTEHTNTDPSKSTEQLPSDSEIRPNRLQNNLGAKGRVTNEGNTVEKTLHAHEKELNALSEKAPTLMNEEDRILQNVLRNYEELDALRKLVPSQEEVSSAEIVKGCDEEIEELDSANKDLTERMDYLVMRIGHDLVNEIENQQSNDVDSRDDDTFADESKEGGLKRVEETVQNTENSNSPSKLLSKPQLYHERENSTVTIGTGSTSDLKAKYLMREGRTIECILRLYEKELEAVSKLVPSETGNEFTISDLIENYERKIDDLRNRNENLLERLDKFAESTGPSPLNYLESMESPQTYDSLNTSNTTESEKETLENVARNYEKEQDALQNLIPKEKEQGFVHERIKGYEDKLKQLEKEKTILKNSLDKLEARIGPDLVCDLRKLHEEKPDVDMRASAAEGTPERGNVSLREKLKVLDIMMKNDLTLAEVISRYEKNIEGLEGDTKSLNDLGESLATWLSAEEGGNQLPSQEDKYHHLLEDDEPPKTGKLPEEMENHHRVENGRRSQTADSSSKMTSEKSVISDTDKLESNRGNGKEEQIFSTAPNIMQDKNKIFENVPKGYEKEPNTSCTLIPGDERESFSDIVKKYEDKIDHLEKQNKFLEEQLGRLETVIGPKLVEDLKKLKGERYEEIKAGAVVCEEVDTRETSEGNTFAGFENSLGEGNEVPIRDQLKAPEVMNENECTLEEVVAIYEKNLEGLNEETKIFKDSLGRSLAKRLIKMANPKAWSLSQEDNRELPTPDDLKAITIMEDEGKSIENILRNYEKELDALSKLVEGEMEQGHSARNLVKKYDDNMENIEGENKSSTKKLEDLTEVTGRRLENDCENLESEETHQERYVTKDENKLETIMPHSTPRNEERTSENMVKNNETGLGALKNQTPKDDGEGSVADIEKNYEAKSEVLTKESESLRNSLDKLETSMGPNLVEQMEKLGRRTSNGNKTATTAKENETEEAEARDKLHATAIMEEKELTLQEVMPSYEKNEDNLRRQLDVLKEILGEGLAASLLIIAEGRDFSTNLSEDHPRDLFLPEGKQSMETAHSTKEMGTLVIEEHETSSGNTKRPAQIMRKFVPKQNKEEFAMDKTPVTEGLKAKLIIRDEGKTIEDILKTYERELEILSTLVPTESEHGSSISDLVENYEEKIDELQTNAKNWSERFVFLVKTIGPGLLETLEFNRTKCDEEGDHGKEEKNENVLRAPSVMRNEDRTLEHVVRNYEKELDILRKLIPNGEEEECSISEILKDYEAKIEGIKQENMTLTNQVHNLEARIGPNLVTVLRKLEETSNSNLENTNVMLEEEKTHDVKLRLLLKATDVMDKNDLTLEEIVETYEKSIKDLEEETNVFKEALGNGLASWLLCVEKEKHTLSQIDLDDHKHEAVFLEDVGSRTTGGMGQKTETMPLKRSDQPLSAQSIGNSPVSEASQLDDLKAKELMRNEGKTVLNILINYEKKLEALSDLLTSEGSSTSELVVNSEDKIKALKSQNKKLMSRFDKLQRNIGLDLLNDIENLESNEMGQEEENSDNEDFHLQAPSLMRYEERTLENVVRNYEKELDVLRELVPGEKEKTTSISRFVKAYEDKVADLNNENRRLAQILERLKNMIGPNLLEDLEELEKGTLDIRKEVDAGDAEAERQIHKETEIRALLKASEITDDKKISLEVAIIVYEKEIEDLKRETKILKESIGPGLATCLLQMATMKTSDGVNVPSSSELNEERSANFVEDKIDSSAETMSIPQIGKKNEHDIPTDMASPTDEMKAIALIRDEGRTVENILRNYEKKLESLRRLIPGNTKQEAAVLNSPAKDEDTIENLEADEDGRLKCDWAGNEGGHSLGGPFDTMSSLEEGNRKMQREMKNLKEKFGEELVDELLRLDKPEMEKKSKWRAIRKMKEDGTVLSKVLENYERENDKLEREKKALETLVTDSEGGDGASALDVISQYEDEIEQLKERESYLEGMMETLREKVGDILVDNILGLSGDEVVSQKISVKALRIMDKEHKQLLAVIEEYENELTKLKKDDETSISLTGDKDENGTSTMRPGTGYQSQKQEVQNNQNLIDDDFNTLSQRLGGRLVKEIINLGGPRKDFSLEALSIMERENKTLTDVVEQYENNIKRNEREMDILKETISADAKLSSLMSTISAYEDEIASLNIKSEERELLEKKVGKDLSRDLLALSELSKRKQKVGLPLRAIEVMEKNDDKTIEDILEEYEQDHENRSKENETLKQLVSSDVLETALSQKSEIDQLNTAKQVLADDLDFVSAKIGRNFVNELLKRSRKEPEIGSPENDFHMQLIVRVESEEKPLIRLMEECVGETKILQKDREELCKVQAQMVNISERIGKDLFKEIMKIEGEEKEISPHMEVVRLMCEQKKQLAKVIEDYEAELARLMRDNKILRGAREKESNDGSTVLDVIYDYEEKIETMTTDNRELSKKFDKLSEKVGFDLTEELLMLRGGLINAGNAPDLKPARELRALKSVAEDHSTIADVLRKYEEKLMAFDKIELGPLVSGHVNNEEVKLAKLIQVDDRETKIPRSTGETFHDFESLKADMERIIKEDPISVHLEADNSALEPESIQEGEIRTLNNSNKTLPHKLHNVSKHGVELSGSLTESPEGRSDKRGQSTWQPEAYKDTVEDNITSKKGLRGYEEKLEIMFSENEASPTEPWVEKEITKEDEIIAEVVREYESEPVLVTVEDQQHSNHVPVEEVLCNATESEVISHYGDSSQHEDVDNNKTSIKESDRFDYQDINNLDQYLMSLGDLELSQTSVNDEDPESFQRDQESIKEEIVKEEVLTYEEHCDPEYLEKLVGEELSLVEEEVYCEMPETTFTENSVPLYDTETDLREWHEIDGLKDKVKKLEKELEEEKRLKEKHEKDVQDLLNDIVEIKMRQAQDEDDSHQTRTEMKEYIEIEHDNKTLQEDLKRERKRRLSLEESKRDLLDKVDSLMKERQILENEHGSIKDNDNTLQDIINQRKTIGTLSTRIKQLEKEICQLKEALKDKNEEHAKQKEQLLADCEEEKASIMKQFMAGKCELESQLQELLTMNDDLKRNIKNLHTELNSPIEKTEENERVVDRGKDDLKPTDLITKTQEHLEHLLREKEESLANEKRRNESLKQQLDEIEDTLKNTRYDYQGMIDAIQTEKAQIEDELRQENDILTKRLQQEIESSEEKRKDFEDTDRLREDVEMEYGRGKEQLESLVKDSMEDLNRKESRLVSDKPQLEKQWSNEKEEMAATYIKEKRDLQEAFDDELQKRLDENSKQLNTLIEQMRRDFEREKNEMERNFDKERREIKLAVEKNIYEQLLSKNFALESDFQEALNKILQEHNQDIRGVENEIREAEKRFEEDRIKLMEQSKNDKEDLNKNHHKEKKALESTVQNLLKEVVKLKHQRKEMRISHKKDKENIEEIYERERLQFKEEWERYKRGLLNKLQEDFENKLASEKAKFEKSLEEMKQELLTSEKRRNELEGRLQRITRENEDSKVSEKYRSDQTEKQTEAQLKSYTKKVEEEYEKKLMKEKRKFEETLQGLRREIESLQEKRRLIQDKVYNHNPSVVDRQVIEKSIANYKKDLLVKMEEEITQRIARERKPLDDTINELEREIEDLKRQRWELGNQLRRERCRIEEEFDREKERMENQFLKEKEEMKNRLENIIQREMIKRSIEGKVSPTLNPIANETSFSPQTSPRRLRSENASLREDNHRLESEVERLAAKLETLESSFQGIISSEKMKAERMKRIQAKMPKKVTFSDEIETKGLAYSTTGDQNEQLMQALRSRDSQVTQLVAAKRFYEEMISELCEEAGLFELDQNVVI